MFSESIAKYILKPLIYEAYLKLSEKIVQLSIINGYN